MHMLCLLSLCFLLFSFFFISSQYNIHSFAYSARRPFHADELQKRILRFMPVATATAVAPTIETTPSVPVRTATTAQTAPLHASSWSTKQQVDHLSTVVTSVGEALPPPLPLPLPSQRQQLPASNPVACILQNLLRSKGIVWLESQVSSTRGCGQLLLPIFHVPWSGRLGGGK